MHQHTSTKQKQIINIFKTKVVQELTVGRAFDRIIVHLHNASLNKIFVQRINLNKTPPLQAIHFFYTNQVINLCTCRNSTARSWAHNRLLQGLPSGRLAGECTSGVLGEHADGRTLLHTWSQNSTARSKVSKKGQQQIY